MLIAGWEGLQLRPIPSGDTRGVACFQIKAVLFHNTAMLYFSGKQLLSAQLHEAQIVKCLMLCRYFRVINLQVKVSRVIPCSTERLFIINKGGYLLACVNR